MILRSDLDGLGKRGDIVEVADGHAHNYLLPKGHARQQRWIAAGACAGPASADAWPRSRPRDRQTLVPQVITIEPRPVPRASCSARSPLRHRQAVGEIDVDLDRKRPSSRDQDHGQHTVTALHSRSFAITLEVVAAE